MYSLTDLYTELDEKIKDIKEKREESVYWCDRKNLYASIKSLSSYLNKKGIKND